MSKRIHIILSDDDAASLDAICQATSETRSAAIQRMIHRENVDRGAWGEADRAEVYAESALAELRALRSRGL